MASLLEALQAREAAARARVEALRAEVDRLAEQVAGEQELLGRLEVTTQTVVEVLAGEQLPGGDADVVEVLADAGPLRARQVCRAVGPAPSRGIGRGCGPSPERLVERGWLVEAEPGLSACAGGWLRRWTAPAGRGLVGGEGEGGVRGSSS